MAPAVEPDVAPDVAPEPEPVALQPGPDVAPARDFSIFVDVFAVFSSHRLSRKWESSTS